MMQSNVALETRQTNWNLFYDDLTENLDLSLYTLA